MATQHYEISTYIEKSKTGDPSAQYMLGRCYQNGWGVDKDEKKAAAFFEKAADKKHPAALSQLGACYETGFGIPKNPKKATECYQQAANLGDPYGEYLLGSCHEEGRCGIKKDEKKAVQLYQRAIAKKDSNQDPFFNRYFVQPSAYLSLGYCFEHGIGLQEHDLMIAGYYYKLAMEQEEPNAAELYGALKNKLEKKSPSNQKKTPAKPKKPVVPTPNQVLKINDSKKQWHSNLTLLAKMKTVKEISLEAEELLITIQAITDKELEEMMRSFEKFTGQTRTKWQENSIIIQMLLFFTALLTPDKLPPGVSNFIRLLPAETSNIDTLYRIWAILALHGQKILSIAQLQAILANARGLKNIGRYLREVHDLLDSANEIGLNLTNEQNFNELIKIRNDDTSITFSNFLHRRWTEKSRELVQPAFSFLCSLQEESHATAIFVNLWQNMATASYKAQKEYLDMLIQRPSMIILKSLLFSTSFSEILEMTHNQDENELAFIVSLIKEINGIYLKLGLVKSFMSIPRDCLIEPVVKNFIRSLPIGDEKIYQQAIDFVKTVANCAQEIQLGGKGQDLIEPQALEKFLAPIKKDCKNVSAEIDSRIDCLTARLYLRMRLSFFSSEKLPETERLTEAEREICDIDALSKDLGSMLSPSM